MSQSDYPLQHGFQDTQVSSTLGVAHYKVRQTPLRGCLCAKRCTYAGTAKDASQKRLDANLARFWTRSAGFIFVLPGQR